MQNTKQTETLYSISLNVTGRREPVRALCSELRLDSEHVPEGYHRYSVRECDDGSGDPATIERHVLVNHLMDILTKENPDNPITNHDGWLDIEDCDYDDLHCETFPASILAPGYR